MIATVRMRRSKAAGSRGAETRQRSPGHRRRGGCTGLRILRADSQFYNAHAVLDPETGELISGAEVAKIPAYTAFAGRKKSEQVTARLIVRRVRDLAKPPVVREQGELFPVWRYHPFFPDNPAQTLQAEREHRHHAVVEQVIADSKGGAFAHLPSGHFHANAAWLTLWAMAYEAISQPNMIALFSLVRHGLAWNEGDLRRLVSAP
ncbi:hypothetical protein ACWEKM_41095 [Streptomyces sp. NPDC004752]